MKILFPARITRDEFALRLFLFVLSGIVFSIALVFLRPELGQVGASSIELLYGAAALILLLTAIVVPRLRDTGLHAALSILIFVPFVNIIGIVALLFLPTAFDGNLRLRSRTSGCS